MVLSYWQHIVESCIVQPTKVPSWCSQITFFALGIEIPPSTLQYETQLCSTIVPSNYHWSEMKWVKGWERSWFEDCRSESILLRLSAFWKLYGLYCVLESYCISRYQCSMQRLYDITFQAISIEKVNFIHQHFDQLLKLKIDQAMIMCHMTNIKT